MTKTLRDLISECEAEARRQGWGTTIPAAGQFEPTRDDIEWIAAEMGLDTEIVAVMLANGHTHAVLVAGLTIYRLDGGASGMSGQRVALTNGAPVWEEDDAEAFAAALAIAEGAVVQYNITLVCPARPWADAEVHGLDGSVVSTTDGYNDAGQNLAIVEIPAAHSAYFEQQMEEDECVVEYRV